MQIEIIKNMKKQTKGITLVALVVTIIVLLILTGVAISLTIGEDGIITKAMKAEEQTENASKKEQLQLLVLSELLNNKKLEKLKLEAEVQRIFNDVNIKLEDSNNGWNFEQGNLKYKITEDGRILNTQLNTEFYSDLEIGSDIEYSNYPDTSYTGGWKIFYVDQEENNVYIISTNVADNKKPGDYISEYNGTSDFEILQNVNNKYPILKKRMLSSIYLNGVNYVSNNENMKGTQYLLDSSIWNAKYKNEYAEFAIGGPTIDLFCKSWNEKHKNVTNGIKLNYQLSTYGYQYGKSNDLGVSYNFDNYQSLVEYNNSNYDYNFYVLHSHYWLSSPSNGAYEYGIGLVDYRGALNTEWSTVYSRGIRPVVCLKTNIPIYKSDTKYLLAN